MLMALIGSIGLPLSTKEQNAIKYQQARNQLTSYKTSKTFDYRLRQVSFDSSVAVLNEREGTCSREVAVSVRTPPKHDRLANGTAVLAENSDAAGLDRRGIERANTMLNE